MRRIIRCAGDRPWRVLFVLALLSLLAVSQLGGLRIQVSAESMLEQGTPAWDYLVETEETFGAEDMAIIVLRDPAIFDRVKLEKIHEVVRALNNVPQVRRTSSLFSATNLKNIDGTIHTRPFLKSLPATPEQIAELKADAVRNPLVLGNLISADGQTLAINVYFSRPRDDPEFDRIITQVIETLIEPLHQYIETVYQIGLAAMRSDLTDKIQTDQEVSVPLSVGVLLATLVISLRRATAVLMPLATAGISVVWTLGLMAWLDIPVNIMTSIVPALVIIIGSTEDIHLLAEYATGVRNGLDRQAAIGHMADNMGVAVLVTFITTYLGFLSIALNDIQLLFQFGLVSSTGLLFNFVTTVLLVPVMLRFFGHSTATAGGGGTAQQWFRRWAVGLLRMALRYRVPMLIMAGLLVAASLIAATQLRINNNLLDYLDQGSPLRTNVERIHTELSGVHAFSIVLDSGIDDTFLQVKYLEEVLKIQNFIKGMDAFDRTFSFANFVAMINGAMADEVEDWGDGEQRLPDTDAQLREYMLFVRHGTVAPFVSERFDRTRIVIRHNVSSSHELNRAIDRVRDFVDANVDPALRVEITGKSVMSNRAVEKMAYSQLYSLLLVGGVIVALVSMLFVSLRAGIIALLPNLFPVTILFAVMALVGIPLNAGTSMVAAIALGICVDDTMHVMSRFHEQLKRQETRMAALEAMIRAEAVPIFSTSIALAAGFGVFATSSFQPMVNFGLLSAMVILVALLATFVLTPLLLGSSELLTVWDLLSYKVQKEALQRSPLFQGMHVWQIKKILLASEIRVFAEGERLIREGDVASEMFVILEGSVEAQKNDNDGSINHLRTMEIGDLFGEVGPLSGGLRTADVVALENTRVLVLSWSRIDRLTRRFPFLAFRLFRNLTRIIGARLRQTSEYTVRQEKG